MDVLNIRLVVLSGVLEVFVIDGVDGVTAVWVWLVSDQSVVTDGEVMFGNVALLSELVLGGTT